MCIRILKDICPFEQILLTGHLILNIYSDFFFKLTITACYYIWIINIYKETAAGKKRFDND